MYLALAVSPAEFPPAFGVLGYSRITTKEINYFNLRDYHPLRYCFPAISNNNLFFDSSRNLHCHLITPPYYYDGLGFSLFARRYLGNTYLFLFLLVLKCFTSQGALLVIKWQDHRGLLDGVPPFGDLRITGCFAPTRSLSQQRHVLLR